MHTVRLADLVSAQQHGLLPVLGRVAACQDDPHKPTVEDKRSYYWNGPGWHAAYNEARRLMDAGLAVDRAASQVGWTTSELEAAIGRDGQPPGALEPEDFRPRERPRRTVKQRVEGLQGVSQEIQSLARRLYEVEIMTVREVAKTLELPYEKCYLVLIKANTAFRRPGRRGNSSIEERVEETVAPETIEVKPVLSEPRAEKVRRASKDEDKAWRRVLRGSVEKPGAPRRERPVKARGVRRTEAEKALRRVLG